MKKQKKHNQNDYTPQIGDMRQGVLASIINRQATVLLEGEILPCAVPGGLAAQKHGLVVGDRVELAPLGPGEYKVAGRLPRQTTLSRGDRRTPGEEIPIAANVNYLLAVVTADYLLHQAGYPEAAIIAAGRAGIQIGLYISKWDLAGESARAALQGKLEVYRKSAAVFTGATNERNDALLQALRGKTAAVVGDRGCGKTSLILGMLQGFLGEEPQFPKPPGTHTGTLYAGPGGTLLLDSPGFRDFALQGVAEGELRGAFPEMDEAAPCAFGNCSHTCEEGCGVLAAVRAGAIDKERYRLYQKLAGTLPERPKADYRREACPESFTCKVCGELVVPEGAGSRHRNHCPRCLSSVHVDDQPGDRASLCHGTMEPVSVWVRKDGEWAIIHRCRDCGTLSSNRIGADDNPILLMSIALKPLSMPPFPLGELGKHIAG